MLCRAACSCRWISKVTVVSSTKCVGSLQPAPDVACKRQHTCVAGNYTACATAWIGSPRTGQQAFQCSEPMLPSARASQSNTAAQTAPRSFNATAIVQPFEAAAIADSISAGEAPVYRLNDIEARAEGGSADGAVSVRLDLDGGITARAGECVLMRLQYASAGDHTLVRCRHWYPALSGV